VSDVLRQRTGPQPRAKRDELADSVVARAIRSDAAGDVLSALTVAGMAGDDARHGTPEPRALDWLIRIHRESLNQEMRQGALLAMPLVINRGRALPYLIEVATARNDSTSPVALYWLMDMATGGGYPVSAGEQREALAALRRMWDEGRVSNGLAVVYLREFAWGQRWPKPRS